MSTEEQEASRNISRRALLGGVAVIGGAGVVGAWQLRDQIDTGTPDDNPATADEQVSGSRTAWSSMYGNPGLTGFTSDPGPGDTESAGVVWTSDLRDFRASSSPIVADDIVYAYGARAGMAYLVAIDVRTGMELWDMPLDSQTATGGTVGMLMSPLSADAASLAVDIDMLFVVTSRGQVLGIDTARQEVMWGTELPWPAGRVPDDHRDTPPAGLPRVALPVVSGDRLFVAANDYVLHALDISDGSEAWSFPLGYSSNEPCQALPIAGDGAVIIGSGTTESPDRMYILDTETGDERFRLPRDGEAQPPEREYAAWLDGHVVLLDERILRLSALTGGGVMVAEGVVPDRQPVVADDAMYIVSEPGDTISRIEPGSGDPLEFSVPKMLSGLVAGEDTLYFASADDTEMPTGLFAYDRHSGEQRWQVELVPSRHLPGLAVYSHLAIVPLDNGQMAAVGRIQDES